MKATIPATWGNKTAYDFNKWMLKIKSIFYADNEKMENAFLKFNQKNI